MSKRRAALTLPHPGGLTVTVGGRVLSATSFRDASAKVVRYTGDMGSSEFYQGRDQGVVRYNGEKVAHVSYNGRVWCARCEGEIDPDPGIRFPSSKGPCRCGNTSGDGR